MTHNHIIDSKVYRKDHKTPDGCPICSMMKSLNTTPRYTPVKDKDTEESESDKEEEK